MQRIGYAVTIGDGAYVRNWPSTTSVIIAELPVNQAVYVAGQIYVDGVAWHEVQYDGQQWGYIRADMLRMMSEPEVLSYLSQTEATEEPAPTAVATLSPLDPEGLSSYGYVSSSTVNFRTQPSMNSERIRQLKKYALCLVLGTETVNGKTWYKVSYDGKTGYISGDYFKQMTLTELESFLNAGNYQEGITANSGGNSSAGSSGGSNGSGGSGGGSQGTAGALVSAEDQKVEAWVNPNSGIEVSYEPFDPFATVAPLNENDPAYTEYLDSLVERMKAGSLTEEGLQTVLEVAYRDNTNASEVIRKATEYIHGKLESTETEAPTETPEAIPLETAAPEFPQEESTGSPAGGRRRRICLVCQSASETEGGAGRRQEARVPAGPGDEENLRGGGRQACTARGAEPEGNGFPSGCLNACGTEDGHLYGAQRIGRGAAGQRGGKGSGFGSEKLWKSH